MLRVILFVPAMALALGGCLSSGSNPNCKTTVLPGQGSYQMCTVGNVILLESSGGHYTEAYPQTVADPEPVAAAPQPAEESEPIVLDPVTGEPIFNEDEPVVIN